MEVCTREAFEEWKFHPVTKKLFQLLINDSNDMKDGLVNGSYEDEAEVKGRCRALAIILKLEYEDLFDGN
jgi:hypothetical protein